LAVPGSCARGCGRRSRKGTGGISQHVVVDHEPGDGVAADQLERLAADVIPHVA